VRPDPAVSDALILTMTGIGQKVVVSGTITDAKRGTILMQRL